MEVSKRKAIILTKNGGFERIRLRNGERPEIGQEYIYPLEQSLSRSYMPFKRMVVPSFSVALTLLIIFVLVAGAFPFSSNKASAAAYVSFDINPSIEVAVDDNMNIIKVRALNKDAEELLTNSDYQDTSLLYFSQSLFEILEKNGYLDSYHDLLITTSLDDQSLPTEVEQLLEESINTIKQNSKLQGTSVVVSVMTTTLATREKANKHGVSIGKYLVYQDAVKNGNALSLDQASSLSYTELRHIVAKDPQEESEQTEATMKPSVKPEHVNRTNNDVEMANPEAPKSSNPATDEVKKVNQEVIKPEPVDAAQGKKDKEKKEKTSMKMERKNDHTQDKKHDDKLHKKLELYLPEWNGEHHPPGQLKKLERLQLNNKNSGDDKDQPKKHPLKHEHPKNKHGK